MLKTQKSKLNNKSYFKNYMQRKNVKTEVNKKYY